MSDSFKKKYDLIHRRNEAIRIREKYADKIPVIVEQYNHSGFNHIDKNKFLVPKDLTIGQFAIRLF